MAATTEEDGATWCRREECGMLFDARSGTEAHEENCGTNSPSYLQ